MNHSESVKAVCNRTEVAAMTGTGQLHALGRVVAYCEAPQVLILTEDGTKIWWRADMTVEVE